MCSPTCVRVLALVLAFALAVVASPGDGSAQPRKTLPELAAEVERLSVELERAAAQSETSAAAVQELSTRVAELAQELDRLRREHKAVPDALEVLDDLGLRMRAVEQAIAELRTRVATVETPAIAAPDAGAVAYDEGFRWATADGGSSLRLTAYLQPRYELSFPRDFDTIAISTFRVRRARAGLDGHLLSEEMRYALSLEFTAPDAPLRDLFLEYRFRDELRLRVGQAKVPFSRGWLTSGWELAFLERPGPLEAIRYDRDIGAWLGGTLAGGRLDYRAGFSNGAGQNRGNDNIDFVGAARVEAAVAGDQLRGPYGDFARVERPSLSVGAGFAHDLVRLPATIAGIDVGNRDVDGDQVIDNVRVLSVSADLLFRYRGLELAAEGFYRHERWGTILDHSANQPLRDAIEPSAAGTRNYLGFYAHANYFVLPERLMVGGRVSHGRLPLLPVGGRVVFAQAPPGQRLLELDGLVQLYDRRGVRSLGLMYRLENFNRIGAPDPPNDLHHIVLVEAQLKI